MDGDRHLRAGFLDRLHRGLHFLGALRACFSGGPRFAGKGLRGLGTFAVAFGHAADLLDRGARFLERCSLFICVLRERLAGRGELTGGGDDLVRAIAERIGDVGKDAVEAADDDEGDRGAGRKHDDDGKVHHARRVVGDGNAFLRGHFGDPFVVIHFVLKIGLQLLKGRLDLFLEQGERLFVFQAKAQLTGGGPGFVKSVAVGNHLLEHFPFAALD